MLQCGTLILIFGTVIRAVKVKVWIFASQQQRDQQLALLKCTPCPHCKHIGALNRHGFLRGYDQQNFRNKTIRALRIFCSNRAAHQGCGKTFSLWLADKVKRLFLDTQPLWDFLLQATISGNRSRAFHQLDCAMSDSAPWRIWRRFLNAQSKIRTALSALAPPQPANCGGAPDDFDHAPPETPEAATINHLKEVFQNSSVTDATLDPIAAFQLKTQSFFF